MENSTKNYKLSTLIIFVSLLAFGTLYFTMYSDYAITNINANNLVIYQTLSIILYFGSLTAAIFLLFAVLFITESSMTKRIFVVYFVMFFFAVFVQVSLFLTDVVDRDDPFHIMRLSSVTNVLYYGSIFTIYIVLFRKYFIKEFDKFKLNIRMYVITLIVGFFLILIVAIVANILIVATGETDTSANQQALNALLNGAWFDKFFLFLFSVVFAPVVEEMIFRKATFDFLDKQKMSPLMTIFISAAFFGLVHVTSGDFVQVIYYSALGAFLALAYHYSKRNIYIPIGIHLSLNLYVVINMLF